MWLDRLAAQATTPSTTPPGSRAYSPSPVRRTPSGLGPYVTSQQRPGLVPRSSSFQSLTSNDSSTSSLLAYSRRPNGSALKQSTTAYVGPDPVDVLRQLLGEESDAAATEKQAAGSVTEDALDLDFDFGGLSLTELAHADDYGEDSADVHRTQTVEECMFSIAHPRLRFFR